MSNENKSSNSSVGLTGLLFIVFLVLKLCDVIDWSWWWVTAPLWIPIGIWVTVFVLCIPIAGGMKLWENYQKKKNNH